MRLAHLATQRQVIVLTHRLSLYGSLEEAEKKVREQEGINKNLEQNRIETLNGCSGNPSSGRVWAQKTKNGNEKLIEDLSKAQKDLNESGDTEIFKSKITGICKDFRELLERTVEDDLLDESIKRHRASIMTDKKLHKISKINKEDADLLDKLMTKYSKFVHSQSQEVYETPPDVEELSQDLEKLKEWREEFKKR